MDAYRQHYQDQAVTTASPAQLVQMLYQGAIAAVVRAEQSLRAGGPPEPAHRDLVKAQDIVAELLVSLDHDAGGAIADNLASLYDYCLDRLQAANLTKDPDLLPSVHAVLVDLSEAWAEVVRSSLSTAVVGPVAAVG